MLSKIAFFVIIFIFLQIFKGNSYFFSELFIISPFPSVKRLRAVKCQMRLKWVQLFNIIFMSDNDTLFTLIAHSRRLWCRVTRLIIHSSRHIVAPINVTATHQLISLSLSPCSCYTLACHLSHHGCVHLICWSLFSSSLSLCSLSSPLVDGDNKISRLLTR